MGSRWSCGCRWSANRRGGRQASRNAIRTATTAAIRGRRPRHAWMAWHEASPGSLRADADPDPRAPRDRKRPRLARRLDEERAAGEIEPVLRRRNAERLGEIAGAAAQAVLI